MFTFGYQSFFTIMPNIISYLNRFFSRVTHINYIPNSCKYVDYNLIEVHAKYLCCRFQSFYTYYLLVQKSHSIFLKSWSVPCISLIPWNGETFFEVISTIQMNVASYFISNIIQQLTTVGKQLFVENIYNYQTRNKKLITYDS